MRICWIGKAAFNDITSGTNYSGSPTGFTAGPGWDACTGLGSPIGTKLITVVNPSTTSAKSKDSKKKPIKKRAAKKSPISRGKPSRSR